MVSYNEPGPPRYKSKVFLRSLLSVSYKVDSNSVIPSLNSALPNWACPMFSILLLIESNFCNILAASLAALLAISLALSILPAIFSPIPIILSKNDPMPNGMRAKIAETAPAVSCAASEDSTKLSSYLWVAPDVL